MQGASASARGPMEAGAAWLGVVAASGAGVAIAVGWLVAAVGWLVAAEG